MFCLAAVMDSRFVSKSAIQTSIIPPEVQTINNEFISGFGRYTAQKVVANSLNQGPAPSYKPHINLRHRNRILQHGTHSINRHVRSQQRFHFIPHNHTRLHRLLQNASHIKNPIPRMTVILNMGISGCAARYLPQSCPKETGRRYLPCL